MSRYAMRWKDNRKRTEEFRKFTFNFSIVPEKYRNDLGSAMIWAKGYLASKYGIPKKNVNIHDAWRMKE